MFKIIERELDTSICNCCGSIKKFVHGEVEGSGGDALYTLILARHASGRVGAELVMSINPPSLGNKFQMFRIGMNPTPKGIGFAFLDWEKKERRKLSPDFPLVDKKKALAQSQEDKDYFWAICDYIVQNDSRFLEFRNHTPSTTH